MDVSPVTKESIDHACAILRSSGIVAHATETCYGLACDMSNPEALVKLFTLKKRPENMPVSALFASLDQAKEYLEWNDTAEKLAAEHLPGPLTIILPLKPDAPKTLLPSPQLLTPNPSLGLRFSPHPTAQALVEAFGSPISTTSANVHGGPNPYSPGEVLEQLEPDLVLDDGALEENTPSKVMDCSGGELRILR